MWTAVISILDLFHFRSLTTSLLLLWDPNVLNLPRKIAALLQDSVKLPAQLGLEPHETPAGLDAQRHEAGSPAQKLCYPSTQLSHRQHCCFPAKLVASLRWAPALKATWASIHLMEQDGWTRVKRWIPYALRHVGFLRLTTVVSSDEHKLFKLNFDHLAFLSKYTNMCVPFRQRQ